MSTALARHRRQMTVLTAIVVALLALLPAPGTAAQLAILVIAVALLGVPHGALDHLLGRSLLRPALGRWWWLAFGFVYLGLAGAMLALWTLVPVAALAAFLALAALHFGSDDPTWQPTLPAAWAWSERLAVGAIPLTVPCIAHPAATATAFAWLLPPAWKGAAPAVVSATAAVGLLALPLAALRCWRLLGRRRPAARAAALEVVAVVALHVAAPPLLAFVVYFCGWHSARHTLELAADLDRRGDVKRGVLRFARRAAPLTLVTLGLAVAALPALATTRLPAEVAATLVFVGLSALTLPHMVLVAASRSRLATTTITGRS